MTMFGLAVSASAQSFPAKPVKIIVPSTPGDGSDILARALGQKLTERWGQPVVIENRPGAGGVVGTESAARSAADGYTVIMGNAGSHAINQALYPKLSYDVVRDFAPITLVASAPNVFVVNPSVPAKTVAEFIALAKKEPNKYSFASGGTGSSAHLNGEMLKAFAGIEMTHVPYKGSSPAVADVIGGQVQLLIGNLPPILPHIKSGKVRALGVSTATRFAATPDLPPVAETVPGFESLAWFGLFAPAGTPRDILARWHTDVVAVLALPDIRERVAQLGFDVVGNTPDAYATLVKNDIAKWQRVVKASGAKAE
ncbi:MAG: tripartite tricarboxylate transporter substrate binding protein [Burkholderiales bacterium]|nr:tripartite tricarboxylate transporter substrate binding protein [Burkholderiales bacterium]